MVIEEVMPIRGAAMTEEMIRMLMISKNSEEEEMVMMKLKMVTDRKGGEAMVKMKVWLSGEGERERRIKKEGERKFAQLGRKKMWSWFCS